MNNSLYTQVNCLVDMVGEYLNRLQLSEKAAVSIEELENDCVLHMHAQPSSKCGSSAKLAISSAQNTIRLYSKSNLAYTSTIRAHDDLVTGVKFSQENYNLLYSSSKDGSIRCWDLRQNLEKPCNKYEGMLKGDEKTLSCFDISCDGLVLCGGTEATSKGDSYILFWDVRKPDPSRQFSECHREDMKAISFHPTMPSSLVTSSADCLVNIFDINETEEDDAIVTSFTTLDSSTSLGWCGEKLDKVYCTTHGTHLYVWDAKEFDEVLCLENIKETSKESSLKVDYLVDCFFKGGSDLPLVLAGSHSGQFHLFDIDGSKLKHMTTLKDGHKDDVRCISWDPQNQSLITGGDDGMLCLWSRTAQVPSLEKKSTNKAKSKLKPKRKGPITAAGRTYHKS